MKTKRSIALLISVIMILACAPMLIFPASAASAPSGAKEYKGHTYYVYSGKYSWHKAKSLCEARGGHLATITSKGENNFIRKLVDAKGNGYCWLGATDEAKEGTWKWVTGEKFKYKGWASSQPDNEYGKEHYLIIWGSSNDFLWNDYPSSGDRLTGYVCEWDMTKAKANSARLRKTSETVYYGSTVTLKMLNNKKKINWSTSNSKIATVSSKGVVTGKALGTAKITAKIGKKSYKCTVKVVERNQKATTSLKTTDGGIFIYGTNSAKASIKLKSYPASKATVYIINTDGSSVFKKTFKKLKKNTTYSFTWNGKNSKGKVCPTGSYRMKVVVGTKASYSGYLALKAKNEFAGGNGSKKTPFLVSNMTQLKRIIKYPNAYFKQTKNIDFDYTGITTMFSSTQPFSGIYNGNGKSIQNSVSTAPLFNYIGEKGQIKNLSIVNAAVTGTETSACLAETNYGKISGCTVNGNISANSANEDVNVYAGLIATFNYGTISQCSTQGKAIAVCRYTTVCGGVCAINYKSGKIIDCNTNTNTSSETPSNYHIAYSGGIVGNNEGFITNCEANGEIFAGRRKYNGGIAGYNSGTVTSSVYIGTQELSIVGGNEGNVA